MRAEDIEQLAAKLGRTPAGFSAFEGLTADQVGLLSDAIEAACARQRRSLDAAVAETVPAVPRPILLGLLRPRGE